MNYESGMCFVCTQLIRRCLRTCGRSGRQGVPANVTAQGGVMEVTLPSKGSSPQTGSVRRNFSWTMLGNIIYAACQWATLVVLAKLGTPEVVGRFAFAFALTAPVIMLCNLQLTPVIASDANHDYRFADYLALRLITMALAMLVVLGIAATQYQSPEVAFTIVAVGLAKIFDSISDIHYGLSQKYERFEIVARSLLMRSTLGLSTLGIVFYLTGSIMWATIGLAMSSAAVCFAYDVWTPRRLARNLAGQPQKDGGPGAGQRLPIDTKAIRRLAVLTLPMGFVMMLISLNTNIPRYFVERYLGEHSLGIFSAMVYTMTAATLVVAAVCQAAIPRLAKHYRAGDSTGYCAMLAKMVGVGAAIGGLGVVSVLLGGKWMLKVFYGPEYAQHWNVFVLISAAYAAWSVQRFLDSGMTVARQFRIQVPLFMLVGVVTAFGCIWLIPRHGLVGAAEVLLIANIVLMLGALLVNIQVLAKLRRQSNDA